jgi:uncharacterized protein YjbJ (UPF0337 family)
MDSETSISDEAVERVTAAVKKSAGTATGNEALRREGELHKKKAQAQRQARKQNARAAVTQDVAQTREEEREAATRRAELLAQKQAEHGMTEVDQEGHAAEQAVQELTDQGRAATQMNQRRKKQAAQRTRSTAHREKVTRDQQASNPRQKAHHESGDTGLAYRVISFGLDVARLPLTVVEKMTGKQNSDWAPATGFRAIRAGVLQVAAGLLRNEDLARGGLSEQAAAKNRARKASDGIGKRHRTDALSAASDQTRAAAARKRAVRKAENVVDIDERIEQSKRTRKSS